MNHSFTVNHLFSFYFSSAKYESSSAFICGKKFMQPINFSWNALPGLCLFLKIPLLSTWLEIISPSGINWVFAEFSPFWSDCRQEGGCHLNVSIPLSRVCFCLSQVLLGCQDKKKRKKIVGCRQSIKMLHTEKQTLPHFYVKPTSGWIRIFFI